MKVKDPQSQVGLMLLQLLEQQDGSSLISPFRSTRLELAHLLTLLALNNSDGQQVNNTLQKIAVACQQFNLKLSLQQQLPSQEEETGTVDVTSQSQLASAVLHKNTAETVCLLVSCGIQRLPMWRISGAMRSLALSALLSAGSMTSSALETARMCHGTCMLVTGASVRTFNPSIPISFNSSIPEDLCAQLLQLFDTQSKDPTVSLHSKETLVKCTALLMGDNWFCLSNDERKVCKDVFARGLDDPKPEVQQLAQAGMIAYLSYKSVSELASIAAIYTKNSDILADREKKLKRLASKADEASSDSSKRHNTVLMMSCVLLATPYDLPPYVPALITSLCRHISISALRDTITRTVQLFKRTHQDRWDSEFKALFTLDQLAELQGTGAAHYYS